MDIHVEQRFKHHHALRGERLPMPAQAWQVVVETGGRQPWFSSFHVACEAVRAFRRASAGGDWTLLAWVLLADRAHWLLQPGASVPLTVAVSRMKATTGAGVNRMLARAGPLWEPAFDCRALGAAEDLRVAARGQRRVDQLGVLGPQPRHGGAAALAVGVGISGQVVVDQALDVAHRKRS